MQLCKSMQRKALTKGSRATLKKKKLVMLFLQNVSDFPFPLHFFIQHLPNTYMSQVSPWIREMQRWKTQALALNEYFLLQKMQKTRTPTTKSHHAEMHTVPWGHTGGRWTQTRKSREDGPVQVTSEPRTNRSSWRQGFEDLDTNAARPSSQERARPFRKL